MSNISGGSRLPGASVGYIGRHLIQDRLSNRAIVPTDELDTQASASLELNTANLVKGGSIRSALPFFNTTMSVGWPIGNPIWQTSAVKALAGPGVLPSSSRRMGAEQLNAIELSQSKVEELNIKFITKAEDAKPFMDILMAGKEVRLATAGYLAAPDGYEIPTLKFLGELSDCLGGSLGIVTSPTADAGSIDAISSGVAQKKGLPVGYVTTDQYLQHVDPNGKKFSGDIDKKAFAAIPKFSMPDASEYSRATAVLSNSYLLTGGRDTSISDFQHAIEAGNKTVILINKENIKPSWDVAKGCVDNGSAYVAAFLSAKLDGIDMSSEFNQKFQKFVETHTTLSSLVLIVNTADPQAAEKAADFFKNR